MGVEVDVSGLLRVLGELPARVEAANRLAAEQAGLVYERFIKEEIKGGHSKKEKTGASPGGPPQNVTGNLRRSVTVLPVVSAGLRATVEVGPSAYYSQYLEGGINPRRAAHARFRNAERQGFGPSILVRAGTKEGESVKYPFVRPGAEKAEGSGAVELAVITQWRRALGV